MDSVLQTFTLGLLARVFSTSLVSCSRVLSRTILFYLCVLIVAVDVGLSVSFIVSPLLYFISIVVFKKWKECGKQWREQNRNRRNISAEKYENNMVSLRERVSQRMSEKQQPHEMKTNDEKIIIIIHNKQKKTRKNNEWMNGICLYSPCGYRAPDKVSSRFFLLFFVFFNVYYRISVHEIPILMKTK